MGKAAIVAGGAAGGGTLAHVLSKGDMAMTAAGAAGGAILTAVAQSQIQKGGVANYNQGYDRGRSDATKETYWVLQKPLPSASRKSEPPPQSFSFQAPAKSPSGINHVPNEITVRAWD